MKTTGAPRITHVLFLSLLLAGPAAGCAQMTPALTPTVSFTRAQIDDIMYRREWGDALAEIAQAIGSTRPEVRQAERQEMARLRAEVRQ